MDKSIDDKKFIIPAIHLWGTDFFTTHIMKYIPDPDIFIHASGAILSMDTDKWIRHLPVIKTKDSSYDPYRIGVYIGEGLFVEFNRMVIRENRPVELALANKFDKYQILGSENLSTAFLNESIE